MKLFAVHDSKAAIYLNPITQRNASEAIRAFSTVCSDPDSQFNRYPSDFTLVQLADFDNDTGTIIPLNAPLILSNASDHIKID